jgi:hypothetical protein
MLFFGALVVFSKEGVKSPILDSSAFINEHLFSIALLLFLKSFIDSSIGILIVYGVIVLKIGLIIFNIFLAFKTKEQYNQLSTNYDISILFIGSIWLIVLICLLAKKYLR